MQIRQWLDGQVTITRWWILGLAAIAVVLIGATRHEPTVIESSGKPILCHATATGYKLVSVPARAAYGIHYLNDPKDIIPDVVWNNHEYAKNWDPVHRKIWEHGCRT